MLALWMLRGQFGPRAILRGIGLLNRSAIQWAREAPEGVRARGGAG